MSLKGVVNVPHSPPKAETLGKHNISERLPRHGCHLTNKFYHSHKLTSNCPSRHSLFCILQPGKADAALPCCERCCERSRCCCCGGRGRCYLLRFCRLLPGGTTAQGTWKQQRRWRGLRRRWVSTGSDCQNYRARIKGAVSRRAYYNTLYAL